MGAFYEIVSTPVAYAERPALTGDGMFAGAPKSIPFGPGRLQHCVLWEPANVVHKEPVFWFHGGAFLVGTPESMIDAARVWCHEGYRFVSVGFRLVPHDRFPAQVDDAYEGVLATQAWLSEHGLPHEHVIVGGSSAGGQLACLLGYSERLAERYGFDRSAVSAVVSCAAIVDADDLELAPIRPLSLWKSFVDLPCKDPKSAGAIHEALLPYSPIALAREAEGLQLPPFFAIQGSSDTLSPYPHQQAFVEALRGHGTEAVLETIADPRWQHMIGTVTMHRKDPDTFVPLKRLFSWLSGIDAKGAGSDR
ncbi:MAG: alpha/beta hydrolase [Atopobiaceae bacterium]